MKKGQFVLIVGPTCVGKTVLINALRSRIRDTGVIVSTTTRAIRPNEKNGVDYEFVTKNEFLERRKANEFYEAVERPDGNFYGSSRTLVQKLLLKHRVVFGALNVEGCRMVKLLEPETLVIFLYPGEMEDLKKRLILRGTSEEEIRFRLAVAEEEMHSRDMFDEAVRNVDGKFDETVEKTLMILEQSGITGTTGG